MTLEGGHVLFFCSEPLEYCSQIITIEVYIILCPVTYFVCHKGCRWYSVMAIRSSRKIYPRASHHGHPAVSQSIPKGIPSWPSGRFIKNPLTFWFIVLIIY